MTAPGPFLVVEHRPHARAAVGYSLIDRNAPRDHQHVGSFMDQGEAEAVATILNQQDKTYRALLNAPTEEPF